MIVNYLKNCWHQERQHGSKARRDGLYLLLLGCIVFVFLGTALESTLSISMVDFRVPYYCTRCFFHHCDPYKQSDVLRLYEADGGDQNSNMVMSRPDAARFMYLPTLFSFTAPFALLSYGPAHITWLALTICGLIIAAVLIWNISADFAPVVAGLLIGFMLANSELLVLIGNPAGIAISLCIVGIWCLVQERLVPLGILSLAIALLVKPHDAGIVWLYFLLAGGIYRKRALQTFVVVLVLGMPTVLWVSHVAPNWVSELNSIMSSAAAHGAINDPSPGSGGAHRLGMMVNLQTAVSDFWDNPSIYNPVTYVICGALLMGWIITTLRSRPSPARTWLALAAVSSLTMLPVYHRQLDTKLLLLSVPGCAMLCAEKSRTGRAAFVFTAAAFVFNGDIPWLIVLTIISHVNIPNTAFFSQLVIAAQVLPAPLSLLAMSVFYVWVYSQRIAEKSADLGAIKRALA
jgi:hypothetical protein